jgi:small subunit ribosomal protein S8
MSMTDPIADMLSRIRNGIQAHHDRVEIPASKLKVEIAKILKSEGFIRNYSLIDNKEKPQATLRVDLKYSPDGEPVIHGIERVSRPGRRIYRNKQEIPRPLGGLGLAIVSTSKGVLAGHEAAKNGIGGEVLCQVW